MTLQKVTNLILAVLTFACVILIGGAIALQSITGIILAVIGACFFMGIGFGLKRKFNATKQG